MTTPVLHHYQLTVKDIALSRPFYREFLGLAEIPRPAFPFPGAWFQLPHGQELHIVTVPDPLWRPPKDMEIYETHIALRVPSFREALERLHAHGYHEDFPKDHPGYAAFLKSYQDLMAKLAPFQTEDGMWREVIDHPVAYEEFSATAMIATSMLRGIRNGWIDARTYQPRVDKAWRAIKARVIANGLLMDVCESTNKQNTLDDYLHRAAIFDFDPRSGGMALYFATEMAGLK